MDIMRMPSQTTSYFPSATDLTTRGMASLPRLYYTSYNLQHTDFFINRNGWGASAIDALSTAIIMQNATIVNEILAHVPEINFGVSYNDEAVSLFETTIRYLGGMLSAYDLLQGPDAPFSHLNIDVSLPRQLRLD